MDNYNTKYVCSYSEEDEDDEKYRQDLLNIFGIPEFNEEIIHNSFTILFPKIKNTRMINCMKNVAAKLMSEDCELGLILLYSFGYLYVTHVCVCEILETGELSEQNIELLENII